MASDYFLKLEGIKGESKDASNVGSIEIFFESSRSRSSML